MGHISDKSIEIVRATAPVVKERILDITALFYERMLDRNPQLYKYFNETNQVNKRQVGAFSDMICGSASSEDKCMFSQQSKTLADAVVAYALNIDNLDSLSDTVVRITQKHCALMIQPEDYRIVHDNLVEAIGEVLGDVVTPDIAAAWSEAVMGLAEIFYGIEADLYKKASEEQWSGTKDFKIVDIVDEAADIKSFRMKAADGTGTCPFTPGQYISVFEKPDGKEYFAPRHYTISSQPEDDYYQISVKRLSEGGGNVTRYGIMSNYLHSKKVGDTVKLGPVFGPDLFAKGDKSRAAVFVSVGIGVTPTIAMLPTAIEERPRVAVFHADRDGSTFAFRKDLEDTIGDGNVLSVSYSQPAAGDEEGTSFFSPGRLTASKIAEILKKSGIDCEGGADFYICCGPTATPLINQGLLDMGVKKECLHLEYFGPFVTS